MVAMARWEYKVVLIEESSSERLTSELEEILNEAAGTGWELMQILPVFLNGDSDGAHAIFKRSTTYT